MTTRNEFSFFAISILGPLGAFKAATLLTEDPNTLATVGGLSVAAGTMGMLLGAMNKSLKTAAFAATAFGLAAGAGVHEIKSEQAENRIIADACSHPEYGPYTEQVRINGRSREVHCNAQPVSYIQ